MVLWDLMIIQLYYATGHQPTITGMKLDAGFVGLHGEMVGYKLALAGFLVGLNSLVAQVSYYNDQKLSILYFSEDTTPMDGAFACFVAMYQNE